MFLLFHNQIGGKSATRVGIMLVAAALSGFAVFGMLAFNTLHMVQISGPLYGQLSLIENLDRDYAPPSEYLIGLCVLTSQMDDSRDRTVIEGKIKKFHHDVTVFEQQHAYYERNLPAGPIKDASESVFSTANSFIYILENEFMPLELAGRYEEAHRLRLEKLVPAFEAHERANDTFITLLAPEIARRESIASNLVASRTRLMLLVALAVPLVVMLATAITFADRGAIEKRLRLFARALESAGDCVLICDKDENIVYANPATLRTYEYKESQLLGKSPSLFYSGEVEPDVVNEIRSATKQGGWRGELWNRSRTGRRFPVSLATAIIQDERGADIGTVGVARDISREKAAEEALRASEEKFSKAFRSSPDAIALIDLEAGILEVNDRTSELTGLTADELRGHTLVELGLLQDAAVRQEFVSRLRNDRTVRDFQYTIHKRSGEVVHLLCSGEVIEFGGRLRALTIHRDITRQLAEADERRRAQEALYESHARFRSMFGDSGSGMALVDLQGYPVECNPALVDMLGYSASELCSMPFTQFTHPDDRGKDWDLYRELITGRREKYQIDKRFISKDGRIVWGSLVVSVVKDDQGSPKYAVGMVQDITERKHAEEALLRVSERLQLATSAARIGIWDWDVVNDRLVWDDATYELFGVRREQFSGAYDAWATTLAPEDLERAQADVRAALRGESELRTEYKVVWPDGSVHFIRAIARTFRDAAGDAQRMVGVVYDVTERRMAEEQLRALSDRLRRAKEEEGLRIARELHDEMGGTLTSLKWGLTTLGAEDSGFEPLQTNKKLDEMVGIVDAAIITVRRISSELRPAILDDLGLISAIEWHAKQFQANTGIISTVDALETVEVERDCATAIFRIVQEAMTNVLRHAHASRIEILIEQEENEIVVEVSDNGRGITEREKLGLQSLGILGMRERAQSICGSLEVLGGKGTTVVIRAPVSTRA